MFLKKQKNLYFFLVSLTIFSLIFPFVSKAFGPYGGWGIPPTASPGSSFFGWLKEKLLDVTVINIFIVLFTYLLDFILAIANVFLSACIVLLAIVTNPGFIKVSYTGLDNPIIYTGWEITRNLANMGIVLSLMVIGLATILGIEKYQAKKTLPLLIIIALLINFTPVILGIIVDASNILMYYFLGEFSNFNGVVKIFSDFADKFKGDWGEVTKAETINFVPLANSLGLLAFAIIGGITFLLFAVLFLFRYIAIWIAVILSPIAFVAYIFPKTRQFFSMWWQQFLNWCFIGVVGSFFIRLSYLMLTHKDEIIKPSIPQEETTLLSRLLSPPGAFISALLPSLAVIGFLLIGLYVTLSTSAMGASTIIGFAKKRGKGMAKWVGKTTAKQTLGRFVTSKRGEKFLRRMATLPKTGEAKTRMGKFFSGVGAVTGVRYALRRLGRAGLSYEASLEKEIRNKQKQIEEKFGDNYKKAGATYSSFLPTDWTSKIAMALYLADKKGAKGLGALTESQRREAIRLTAERYPTKLSDLLKYAPELITDPEFKPLVEKIELKNPSEDLDVRKALSIGIEPEKVIEHALLKKIIGGLSQNDIKNLNFAKMKEETRNKVLEMIVRYKDMAFIRKFMEEIPNGPQLIQNTVNKLGIEEVAKTNPRLLKFPYTSGGQVFLDPWERYTREDIKYAIKGGPKDRLSEEEVNRLIQKLQERKPPTTPPPPSPRTKPGPGAKETKKNPRTYRGPGARK